jgi:hypothetical protein
MLSDLGEVAARLNELSDGDVAAVVRQASAGRPALASLHAAAEAACADAVRPEPTEALPDIPQEPQIPSSPDVPAPPIFLVGSDKTAAYTDRGVPTLDGIQDKLDRRGGDGDAPKAAPAARSVEDKWAEREKAGRDRLEEMRESLRRTIRPER